jgi:hypothetical protein
MTQHNLPELISRAAQALANAKTAAEVLDARKHAKAAYVAAKQASRFVEAKEAHDEVMAACHKVMADALEIETRAQCRLADEYDAAQERGEVAKQGEVGGGHTRSSQLEHLPRVNDIGLTRKQVHEARTVRDAEKRRPGMAKKALDEQLKAGKEPTLAVVKRAIKEIMEPKKDKPSAAPKPKSAKQQELDDRNARIIALADGGWSADEIAREFDLVTRLIHRILEVEKARRGSSQIGAEEPAALSMTAQQKLEVAIRLQKRKLDAEFDLRLRNEVRKRLEDTILPSYNESYDKHREVIKSRKGVMDKASYRKLIFCLHPDRVANMKNEILSKRFRDAFDLIINLEKRLLDEKESPTELPPLPRTYQELMKARQTIMEKRRTSKAAAKSALKRR